MKQEYKEAFAEVYEIIKLMPSELTSKIPDEFIKMLEEEKDNTYFPQIKEPIENEKLKDETIVILGLIYRDFLCSREERRNLQEKDAKELKEFQEELDKKMREKYNPNDIFKKNKIDDEKIQNISKTDNVTIYKKEKWYKKILNMIKRIFNKR